MTTQHRVLTVTDTPWGTFPTYRDGGPATVVTDGYSMSIGSLCGFLSSPEVAAADDGHVTLNVSTPIHWSDVATRQFRFDSVKHPLNGTRYATEAEAAHAAYDAGVIGYFVKASAS